MVIKQLSVFLQNKAGRLEQLTSVLAKNGININAMCVAETEEYGVMRMIVDDTEKALKALQENEFFVNTTDVICTETPDIPGELNSILAKLAKNGINVSYMYGYSDNGVARLVLKVSDYEAAMKLL